MDGQRFDYLARSLASGRSRRSIVKTLGAGALAVFGIKRAVEPASATMCFPADAPCDVDVTCCSGSCDQTTHTCNGVPLGGTCTSTGACEAGGTQTACENSICCLIDEQACIDDGDCCSGRCNAGMCASSTCQHIGQTCSTNDDCCFQLGCREDGICDGAYCGVDDETCSSDNDCCSPFTCVSGQCIDQPGTACGTMGSLCEIEEHCCEGYTCGDTGECVAVACLPYYELCENDSQCCSGFCQDDPQHTNFGQCYGVEQGGACTTTAECVNGAYGDICEGGICCRENEGFCNTGSECCSGSCVNGTCQAVVAPTPTPGSGTPTPAPTPKPGETVTPSPTKPSGDLGAVTKLPATGSGSSNGSGEAIAAAGVIGAVALLAAGRRLRRAAEPEN